MNPTRRVLLHRLAAGTLAASSIDARADAVDDSVSPERALTFPRDHGAHPGTRIEWWYATGWLRAAPDAPPIGWQLTFFRSRTALAATRLPGRFAPRQLLFAHAAISDIGARRHRHAQRLARWSGEAAQPEAHAASSDTDVVLGPWSLRRGADGPGGHYAARLPAPDAGFTLALTLAPTQAVLLQGQRGHSRKGPLPQHASHYYTQPQLAVNAQLVIDGRTRTLAGRGWLDHEWSNELMAPGAVGWDWIGINLHDGGALTAFVLRRADGSVVWAGGSHRAAGGALRPFAADELTFTPGRSWTSPASGARYPVEWTITTPVGVFALAALLDAQELDSSASTGAIYWEGLAALREPGTGRELGLGYLEMTGRKAPLKLG